MTRESNIERASTVATLGTVAWRLKPYLTKTNVNFLVQRLVQSKIISASAAPALTASLSALSGAGIVLMLGYASYEIYKICTDIRERCKREEAPLQVAGKDGESKDDDDDAEADAAAEADDGTSHIEPLTEEQFRHLQENGKLVAISSTPEITHQPMQDANLQQEEIPPHDTLLQQNKELQDIVNTLLITMNELRTTVAVQENHNEQLQHMLLSEFGEQEHTNILAHSNSQTGIIQQDQAGNLQHAANEDHNNDQASNIDILAHGANSEDEDDEDEDSSLASSIMYFIASDEHANDPHTPLSASPAPSVASSVVWDEEEQQQEIVAPFAPQPPIFDINDICLYDLSDLI
ncbi:hypothetical protein SYNPS1DRAFT_30471 [Syncephalis pseudoplumigaleata]|uniref:Uncharacterized protein n=1 Tax=Syncephalis pseudoplumigaleata TaxID=1712513 RepID=A0A4P9YVF1_9FUNG|nr:hypothetical protein SYNPS1DRAFT_30471 [Syncephalis pseudoplumigaleata]|eukprot:RKP23775.1 hypothetical protein SYNPS1DRAFT_30471 [Syncephalis pseudoplumigaleata]